MTKRQKLQWEAIGIDKTLELFNKLPEEVQDKILPPSLRVGAKYVMSLAKARAPEDSGWLKNNMKVSKYSKSKTRRNWGPHFVIYGVGWKYDKKHFYPHFVEFGTKFQKPQHFMSKSLEQSQEKIVGIVRRALNVRLPRFAKRYSIKGINL